MRRLETYCLNLLSLSMRSNVTLFFGIIFSLIESLNSNIFQISILVALAPIIWGMTSLVMPFLMSKLSVYQIIQVAAWILALSAVLRLTSGIFNLLFFTLTLNIGVGILNISIPAWVKQIAPTSTDVFLSRHYKIMLLGSGCSIIMAVLLLDGGHGWQWAFAPWLVPSLIAASLMVFVPDRSTVQSKELTKPKAHHSENSAGLSIFIMFFGTQGITSHSFGAFAPSIMVDYGFNTLTSAIACAVLATTGAFIASKFLSHQLSQTALQVFFRISSLLLLVGLLLLLLDQTQLFSIGLLLVFWSQSNIFLISLISISRWSSDVKIVLRVSLRVQGWGYLMAGLGCLCVGLIRQSQGSWEASIYFIICFSAMQVLVGRKTLSTIK